MVGELIMSVEHWWNVNERREPKYAEKQLPYRRFVDHKFHVFWPWIKPSLLP